MKFERRVNFRDLDYLSRTNTNLSHYKHSEQFYYLLEAKYDKLHIVGVSIDNELVCAAILTQEKRKLNFSDFRVIATPYLDFNNLSLLTFFHKNLMEYIKDYSGLTLTFTPDIETTNEEANRNLKSLGYIKNDKVRYIGKIDLSTDIDTLKSKYSDYVTNKLSSKFNFYNFPDKLNIDIDKIYSLLKLQYNDLDISLEDYRTLHDEFYKNGKLEHFVIEISLYDAMLYFKSRIEFCDVEFNKTNDESLLKSKDILIDHLKRIEELQKSYVNEITLGAITFIKNSKKAWCKYEVSNTILKSFDANVYLFNRVIDYCFEYGIDELIIESINPYDKNLLESKLGFNAKIISMVDEYSIVVSKIFNKIVGEKK